MGRQENLRKVDAAWKCCDKAHQNILFLISKAEYGGHEDIAKGLEAVRFMLVECKKILYHIYERMKA
jgi:hypothetical protein